MSLGTVCNVDTFVDNPSKTEYYSLTKPQLKLVADKIVVEYEFNTKKAELCQAKLYWTTLLRKTLFQRSNLPQVTVNSRSDDLN